MLKMGFLLFNLFLLSFLGLTGAGQESIQLLNLYDATPEVIQAMSHSAHPLAISVSLEDLTGVSSSVLKAENWLRTHVLAHFPATKITTIVVGSTILCQNEQDHNLGMILPSLRNIYYSLTRWGIEREVKVSAAFSFNCFNPNSILNKDDLAEKVIRPLLHFLHSVNSTYSINLPPNLSSLSHEAMNLLSSKTESFKKFGSFGPNKINVVVNSQRHKLLMNRKLSTVESKIANPFPARPTPLPETSQPPIHSSIGFSVPANIAKNPHPPLSYAASPPPLSYPHASPPPMVFPFAPQQPPFAGPPAGGPYGYLPPCNPADTTIAPAPALGGIVQELWCVAKPSVPAETLQEALDYACGDGGADCAEIMPNGNCFYPDTVVAHASYAFNSYFQKNKRNGGSCSFGGTAMLITSDPSFLHCRFLLS
ncbi:glucan endo-1,3-beta-glucosidase 3 [Ricinus communis]|uniref:glucan endo-1,3-beta-glucosidase 3 n=1 Tax=Ricinus communis TaxID=3988 RepID=UPI000772D30A|nr:glucan endo-1,3-beta-glucosidase 3 [Ricinus communis]|eukprot:XP_015578515.1 glucan endo-1,3-beta-glucosidase 3 [Ricinus communis]